MKDEYDGVRYYVKPESYLDDGKSLHRCIAMALESVTNLKNPKTMEKVEELIQKIGDIPRDESLWTEFFEKVSSDLSRGFDVFHVKTNDDKRELELKVKAHERWSGSEVISLEVKYNIGKQHFYGLT